LAALAGAADATAALRLGAIANDASARSMGCADAPRLRTLALVVPTARLRCVLASSHHSARSSAFVVKCVA
jgi:hypothetical protein